MPDLLTTRETAERIDPDLMPDPCELADRPLPDLATATWTDLERWYWGDTKCRLAAPRVAWHWDALRRCFLVLHRFAWLFTVEIAIPEWLESRCMTERRRQVADLRHEVLYQRDILDRTNASSATTPCSATRDCP